MNRLDLSPMFPTAQDTLRPESPSQPSGLWPVGAHPHHSAPKVETMRVYAPTDVDQDAIETIRVPMTTRPAAPDSLRAREGAYDVDIPKSPRVPFDLRPRRLPRNQMRAELASAWAALTANARTV